MAFAKPRRQRLRGLLYNGPCSGSKKNNQPRVVCRAPIGQLALTTGQWEWVCLAGTDRRLTFLSLPKDTWRAPALFLRPAPP